MFSGDYLKTLRKEKGATQAEVGQAVGVTQASICSYERGRLEPSASTAEKLACYFGLDADVCWAGRTRPPESNDLRFERLLEVAVTMIATMGSPIERQAYINKVAEATGIDARNIGWKVGVCRTVSGGKSNGD